MQLHGKSFIGGKASTESGDTFTVINPSIGEPLPTAFCKASASEIEAAMAAAEAASPVCRSLPPERVAGLLERMADEILALGNDLIARGIAETGLPEQRLMGERARTMNQLKMFAALVREGSWVDVVIDTADPNRQPLPKPDVRRMLRPIGPVVVFGAGNFPFAFGACGGETPRRPSLREIRSSSRHTLATRAQMNFLHMRPSRPSKRATSLPACLAYFKAPVRLWGRRW